MQTIDTYVGRPASTGWNLRERLDDIRDLCALSVAARARIMAADEPAREQPVRGWSMAQRSEEGAR